MNQTHKPFSIRFTQQVVFKDCTGAVTEVFNVGDVIEARGDTEQYFITSHGGIYHDEAERVE